METRKTPVTQIGASDGAKHSVSECRMPNLCNLRLIVLVTNNYVSDYHFNCILVCISLIVSAVLLFVLGLNEGVEYWGTFVDILKYLQFLLTCFKFPRYPLMFLLFFLGSSCFPDVLLNTKCCFNFLP